MTGRSTTADFVRTVALGFPETEEREHMSSASFRVNGKIFAQLVDGESAALVKVSLAEQDELLARDPKRFWIPDHWGKFGWTYVRLAGSTNRELHELLQASWRRIAPKRLATTLPS